MFQFKSDTVVKWTYIDGDEFNGSSVDLEKWIPSYSYAQINYRFDYIMLPKRIEFENGIAKFMCYRDTGYGGVPDWQLDSAFKKEYKSKLTPDNKFKYIYSCGNVWSKKQFGKGYFEMRFRTTDSYGMWPAFWLYGNNQKDEIDFFELKGERKRSIHVATHCPEGCDKKYKNSGLFPKGFSGWIKTSEALNEQYNVLAGEWQDGYVKWYLNGVGIAYFEGDFASQQMNLIIGTGPAKDHYGFEPGINKTSYFPNSLDVDYVRVWYTGESAKAKNSNSNKTTTYAYLKTDKSEEADLKKKIRYMYSKKAFKNDVVTVSILPSSNKKITVTSLGKEVNYTISFVDTNGKEVLKSNINSSLKEFDMSALTGSDQIKIRINVGTRSVEEIVQLQK